MEAEAILFEDYAYGTSKQAITEKANAVICPKGVGGPLALCAPALIEFLQDKWQEIFVFNNQDELQQIMLIHEGKNQIDSVLEKLERKGWRPAMLENEDSVADMLEEAHRITASSATSQVEEFIDHAKESKSWLTIHFFPAPLLEEAMKAGEGYNQAIDKAGENFCLISLMADADTLKLTFTAPLLARKNALRYGQMIKRQ